MNTEAAADPWHRGEREAQARAGVDPRHSAHVAPFLRRFLTEQHRTFYPLLPSLVVGAVDDGGWPWATILEGGPGFVQSPDDTHLRIAAQAAADDPARAGLAAGRAVGLLGIELSTRRRNRMNGRVEPDPRGALTIAVDQAYGNCPKYIHTRELERVEADAPAPAEVLDALDDAARAAIRAAGTFFVASYVDDGRRQVDVSHRGGRPGFVDVDGDLLTIPDFVGNQFFNTLGNLLANPRAGLLFADFSTGDLLQLTGSAEVLFDSPRIADFAGALRLWQVRVQRVVRRRGALRWRGAVDEVSPEAEATGSWDDARTRPAPTAAGWRPFEVERVVDEADAIRSFHLRPVDPAHFAGGAAGQHLVLRVPGAGDAAPWVRSYSLSRLPRDGGYRISVKRDGAGSSALHAALAAGTRLDVRGPLGEFVVDADSPRPVVLLSAGVGITPVLAMAEHLVAADTRAGRARRIHFLHGARDGAAMPFRAELAALQARSRGLLDVVRVFSRPRPQDEAGVDFERRGRLDIDLLKAVLPFDDHDFYLCGPAAFMQSLHDGLRALGIADARIHAEAFGPSSLRRSPAAAAPPVVAAAGAVPVRFMKSGVAATWTPGAGSLLELAERAGLQPEFGCRSGSCGSCSVRVAHGAVAYPDGVAPAGDGALICSAVPASAVLSLEL